MTAELKLRAWFRQVRGGFNNNNAGPVETVEAQNKSGGALARGDVVVLDRTNTTADLYAVTTTTTGDDPDVFGMVFDASIANNAVGNIQIWGPTAALKADGTDDIAVGDLLSTYTTAKIAKKSYGPNAFALAHEAYTTNDSNGVLDAFLMTRGRIPRLAGTASSARIEKVAKVALATADTGGGVFSWQNPEGAAIVITRLEVDRTTAATSACTLDCGTTATSSTTSADNLIDGLDANAAADVNSNLKNAGTNGKADQRLASGKWVTGSTNGGASAGLVGNAYIHYHPV